MDWLLPYRLEYFDMDYYLLEEGNVEWSNHHKIEAGDTAYLYSGQPEQLIRYKCKVVESSIRDDGDTLFIIELDYEFKKPIKLKEMEPYGLKQKRVPVIKGSSKPELFAYLKEREESEQLHSTESFNDPSPKISEKASSEINELEKGIEALRGAEKDAVVKQRLGQSIFKKNLLEKYYSCCLCGMDELGLLIASHIKPWSKSNDKEKLDTNNGLLLCPAHDKAFDLGYISFDENGSIMISKTLNKHNRKMLNIDEQKSIRIDEQMKKYMDYHRKNKFK